MKVLQANNSNIDEWLNLNFRLFDLAEARSQNMVRMKYYSALNAIKFVELYTSGEKIGHVSCIRQRMYIGSVVSDVAFLTSVYIFPRFRDNGYLLPLLTAAEEIATTENCIASIVVARRAVKDMYSKYGYFGFSIFPSVSMNQNILESRKTPTPFLNLESRGFNERYLETYLNINGTLVRNSMYWDSIKYAIKHGLFGLLEDGSTKSYIVTKKSTAIEVAGSTEGLLNLVRTFCIKKLLISKDHPLFNPLMLLGGEYRYRPETTGGHLIKVLYKNSDVGKLLLSLNLSDSNLGDIKFKPMNLLELNQW
jgi:predicted acetyltransferase